MLVLHFFPEGGFRAGEHPVLHLSDFLFEGGGVAGSVAVGAVGVAEVGEEVGEVVFHGAVGFETVTN